MPTVLNTILGRTPARKSRKKGGKKGKTSKRTSRRAGAKRAVPKRAVAKGLSPNDMVDVRSQADVSKLNDLMKDSKIIMVLVYADWCGHCHTFKEDVWSKLANMPERRVPMAQIMAEELANTPLSSAPVDGYPTVMMVGQDMKPTNIEDTRNFEMMSKIVNSDPEMVLANAPMEVLSLQNEGAAADATADNFEEPTAESLVEAEPEYAPEPEPEPKSATPTKKAEEVMDAAVSAAAKTKATKDEFKELSSFSALGASATPPNAEDDMLSSDADLIELTPPSPDDTDAGDYAEADSSTKPMMGGSLYATLLKVATGAAPAAALTGTAIYMGSRRRAHRRTKKVQRKKQTRRSRTRGGRHGTSRRLTR